METVRFTAALAILDDARHLLGVNRWASAISRAYYCSYQAIRTGPGLLEHLRRPLQWLYQKRLDVDYDIRPVTSATAVRAVDIAVQVCQEIQQRSGGLAP